MNKTESQNVFYVYIFSPKLNPVNPSHPFAFLAAYYPHRSSHRRSQRPRGSDFSPFSQLDTLIFSDSLSGYYLRLKILSTSDTAPSKKPQRTNDLCSSKAAILLIGLAFLKVHGIGRYLKNDAN